MSWWNSMALFKNDGIAIVSIVASKCNAQVVIPNGFQLEATFRASPSKFLKLVGSIAWIKSHFTPVFKFVSVTGLQTQITVASGLDQAIIVDCEARTESVVYCKNCAAAHWFPLRLNTTFEIWRNKVIYWIRLLKVANDAASECLGGMGCHHDGKDEDDKRSGSTKIHYNPR